MTPQEAIMNVKAYLPDTDAKKYVIDALEKQIPKAPIPAQDKVVWTIFEFCPTCGVSITGSHLPHCYNCGQKIDWDNVD